MNLRRGFLRLWLAGSAAWVLISLSVAIAVGHIVLTKPDVIVRWGNEKIVYSPDSTEEEIRADLQRRADQTLARDEQEFQNLTQQQRDFCERNSNEKFDQLPLYCQVYAFHGSKLVIPEGWQDQRRASRKLREEAYPLATWMFGPPALLLLIGWVFFWIVRGFQDVKT
jgi:hypothetical protein